MKEKLDYWINQAKSIWFMPDTTGQVSGPVSNFYSHRTRKANDILYKSQQDLGFLSFEVFNAIPMKNREKWDKNIRW